MKGLKEHYRKTFSQIPIYLGKFFRMFIYQDDWKMLPMAALIAGLVSFVIKGSMMQTMEGTLKGSLALSCICIWNGFFNSIQVICRERAIVKREHRSGMKIGAYVLSHMIYQAALCLAEAVISVAVCRVSGIHYPKGGVVTVSFYLDLTITFFLITYASDVMALLISSIARTTTAAMTIMPFVLIFELLFSGAVFSLEGAFSNALSFFTIAKWGMTAICSIGRYNSLRMVSVWGMMKKFQNYEIDGFYPVRELIDAIEAEPDGALKFQETLGSMSPNEEYESTCGNVLSCWFVLVGFVIILGLLTMAALKRIDRDKR